MLTGDHVMHGSTVVIRPPDGDLHQYLASLARVRDATPAVRRLAPGHGRLMDHVPEVIDALIAHRLGRHEVVAAALPDRGEGTVDELLAEVYGDVTERQLPWPGSRCGPTCGRSARRAGPVPRLTRTAGPRTPSTPAGPPPERMAAWPDQPATGSPGRPSLTRAIGGPYSPHLDERRHVLGDHPGHLREPAASSCPRPWQPAPRRRRRRRGQGARGWSRAAGPPDHAPAAGPRPSRTAVGGAVLAGEVAHVLDDPRDPRYPGGPCPPPGMPLLRGHGGRRHDEELGAGQEPGEPHLDVAGPRGRSIIR